MLRGENMSVAWVSLVSFEGSAVFAKNDGGKEVSLLVPPATKFIRGGSIYTVGVVF